MTTTQTSGESLLLVDLSAIYWPSWFSIRGRPISVAVDWTLKKIESLASRFEHVGIACDSGRSFRHDIDPGYKSTRPLRPPEAYEQLVHVEQLLVARGYPLLRSPSFEADDVIATGVRWALEQASPLEVRIAGCDKDLHVLVSPSCAVINTATNKQWGVAEVEDEKGGYGIPPALMRDWLVLVGDSSDNIRGVPRVGAKNATRLLRQFGSVRAVVNACELVDAAGAPLVTPPFIRKSIRIAAADGTIEMATNLVTLRTDVPIDFSVVLAPRVPRVAANDWLPPERRGDAWEGDDESPPEVAAAPAAPASESSRQAEPPAPAPSPAVRAAAPIAPTHELGKVTSMQFKRASRTQAKLRMALIGPAGAGKSYTSLELATRLGERVAVIDTEHGSASKYAGGKPFDFDTLDLESFSPLTYVEAIKAAERAGYDVIVIDSLSHAWMGKDGALEQVDLAAKRSRSGNSFAAWREVTPQHNALVEAMLGSKCHIVATMRAKSEWIIEEDDRGKKVPRKIGLAPIQREGLDFEFDVTGDIDHSCNLIIDKTRCPDLKGKVFHKPGAELAKLLKGWLSEGAPVVASEVSGAAELAAWNERLAEGLARIEACATERDISTTHRELGTMVREQNLPQEMRDQLTAALRTRKAGLGLVKPEPAGSSRGAAA